MATNQSPQPEGSDEQEGSNQGGEPDGTETETQADAGEGQTDTRDEDDDRSQYVKRSELQQVIQQRGRYKEKAQKLELQLRDKSEAERKLRDEQAQKDRDIEAIRSI